MRDGRGDDGKKKMEKEKEGQSLSLSLTRVPEDSSAHGHGHGHAYRAPPSSQVPPSSTQMTIVSTTISAGGRTRTSSQPVFSPPSSKQQAGKPTSSLLRARQQSQTPTQLDRPLSISGGSPPTSNPGSLSSSPTLRPFMAPPLSMRIQSPELLSAAVTSEKDREKERERLVVIGGGSSSSKSTSFSQIANAENESSGYPYIKDKGKGKATSPSTPTASGIAAAAPTMGTDDGHETDDEADEGMSDGNMSGSGFLGGGAESPPFIVSGSPPGGVIKSPGVVRPLPSLPSTPAFPDRFSSAGSSPKSGIVAGTASKGKEGTPELEPAQEDTVKLGVHPRIETDLGDEDLSGFSSDGTLSSPVFAHSDSDSDINSMRRGYGYGFERRRKTKEERDGEGRRTVSGSSAATGGGVGGGGADSRWRTPGDDGESDNAAPEADSSYVYVDDPHETAKEHNSRATSRAQTSRPKSRVKSREKESGGEWIVLDLQDEHGVFSVFIFSVRL